MIKLKEDWSYKVRFNGTSRNAKEWLSDALRYLASRIDGRLSVAISMNSIPEICHRKNLDRLRKGFNHTERLFEGEVKSEAIEKGMRRVAPELYET